MFDSKLLVTLKNPEFKSSLDIKYMNLGKESWCFTSGVPLLFCEVSLKLFYIKGMKTSCLKQRWKNKCCKVIVHSIPSKCG